jgi:hypothetical protein
VLSADAKVVERGRGWFVLRQDIPWVYIEIGTVWGRYSRSQCCHDGRRAHQNDAFTVNDVMRRLGALSFSQMMQLAVLDSGSLCIIPVVIYHVEHYALQAQLFDIHPNTLFYFRSN